ncbi:MAG: hypothetical protein AAB605_03145 [Patescibacteria group bacterium]
MKKLNFAPGSHLNEAAKELVNAAKKNGKAQGYFNGILLAADKTSTAEGIVAYYREETERRAEAYRNSPKGKKAAREAKERLEKMQQKHDELMRQLPNLDFTNNIAVLNWLCEYQDPSDYIGVMKQQDEVVATFVAHGYHPNVNLHENFKEDDRDNYARYIIGQALSMLQGEVGAIHHVIHHFTKKWKEKFFPVAA